MGHVYKDLMESSPDVHRADMQWFLNNPNRARHLREPYPCEKADVSHVPDSHREFIGELVCVYMDKPLGKQVYEFYTEGRGAIVPQIRRRSFLFTGKPVFVEQSDRDVDLFLELIDTNTAPRCRGN